MPFFTKKSMRTVFILKSNCTFASAMEKSFNYKKSVLLLLFVSYIGCLTAFSHVHIEHGRIYVHAHPYEEVPGSPMHHHSICAFQTLDSVSHIMAESLSYSNFVPCPTFFFQRIVGKLVLETIHSIFRVCLTLRGPPALF